MSQVETIKLPTAKSLATADKDGTFFSLAKGSQLTISGAEKKIKSEGFVYVAQQGHRVAGTVNQVIAYFTQKGLVGQLGAFIRYDAQTLFTAPVQIAIQAYQQEMARHKAAHPTKTAAERQNVKNANSARRTTTLGTLVEKLKMFNYKCTEYIRPKSEITIKPRGGKRTGVRTPLSVYNDVLKKRREAPQTHSNYAVDVTNLVPHPNMSSRVKKTGEFKTGMYTGSSKHMIAGVPVMSTNVESYSAFIRKLYEENNMVFGGQQPDQVIQQWLNSKPAGNGRGTTRTMPIANYQGTMPTMAGFSQVSNVPMMPIATAQNVPSPRMQQQAMVPMQQPMVPLPNIPTSQSIPSPRAQQFAIVNGSPLMPSGNIVAPGTPPLNFNNLSQEQQAQLVHMNTIPTGIPSPSRMGSPLFQPAGSVPQSGSPGF